MVWTRRLARFIHRSCVTCSLFSMLFQNVSSGLNNTLQKLALIFFQSTRTSNYGSKRFTSYAISLSIDLIKKIFLSFMFCSSVDIQYFSPRTFIHSFRIKKKPFSLRCIFHNMCKRNFILSNKIHGVI